jgi:hypothetical protein
MAALPQHVLVLVLKRINQDERLKSCALVSTAWAEAAAMATDAVNCCTGNLADLAIFKPWLDHHGLHVTNLSWAYNGRDEYGKQVLSTLPCRNLQQLSLFDWRVQLDGYESPLLQASTGLTYLDLHVYTQYERVDYCGDIGGLGELTALQDLSALQRFELSVGEARALKDYGYMSSWSCSSDTVPSSVIDALSTSMTRLSFNGVLALKSFQPFSCLVKLRHLYMNLQLGVQEDTAMSVQQPFAHLQALTFLSLCMEEPKLNRTSSVPPLAGCSGLQELHLYSPSLDEATSQG